MRFNALNIMVKLLICLGNPGEEYRDTRHNAGFIFADYFIKKNKFDKPALKEKLLAEVSEGKLPAPLKGKANKNKIIVAKPQTFMNKSGNAAALLAKFYKIKPADIIIIHDDSDMPFGYAKNSFNRSSAGHNGVESIFKALKTEKIWRARIGIQPSAKKHIPAGDLVLRKFTQKEKEKLPKIFKELLEKMGQILR